MPGERTMKQFRETSRWSVFVAFTAAYFLSQFFRSANAVIAPTLVQEISLSAADLGLMTSLFFATFALMQIPLGVALDRWGPRWVTAGLMAVAVLGSLVFAAASSFLTLALGRALLGIGMAGILMGALKAFSRWYPQERFATASGLLIGIGSLGGLIAATPLAWMNHLIGWRAVFVGGALLTALGALFIVLGTRNAPTDAPPISAERAENNLGEILRSLTFWRLALPSAWIAGGFIAFRGLWAGPYLFDSYQLTELVTGNLLLILGIGASAGPILSGWLSDRWGIARVILLNAALLIASQAILALRPSLILVTIFYLLFGLSSGFGVVLLSQTRKLFPPHMTGQALSLVNLMGFAGTFLLQWWMGEIIAFFPSAVTGQYLPQAYTLALAIAAVGSVLTLLWYLPLVRPQGKAIPEI
jgi:nitrate/nitrite transporter NarK